MPVPSRDPMIIYFLKHRDILRAALILLIVSGAPLLACELCIFTLRVTPTLAVTGSSLSPANFDRLTLRLDKQKEQRSQWAYAVLVAIVAVSVVKKKIEIPWARTAYLLLGVSGALMFESIRAGDEYERSVAALVVNGVVTSGAFAAANDYLRLQMLWFNTAAFILLLFVGIFITVVLAHKTVQEVH